MEVSQYPEIYFTGIPRNIVVIKNGIISRSIFFEANLRNDDSRLWASEYTRPLIKNSNGKRKEYNV